MALVALLLLADPGTVHAHIETAQERGNAASQGTAILTLAVALVTWVLAAWLTTLCALRLGTRLPGVIGRTAATLSRALTPRVLAGAVRIGITATTGLGIAGQFAPAAQAAVSTASHSGAAVRSWTERCVDATAIPTLDRLPGTCTTPMIAAPVAAPPTKAPAERPAAAGAVRVVKPGDNLWAIAGGELSVATGKPAAPQAIARRWPAWWDANRDVLGSNPALLHPGTVLHAPAAPQPEG